MRLLIIAPSAYLLGGVQNWLDYLLPGLKSYGNDVTLGLADGRIHRSQQYLARHPWSKNVIVSNPTGSSTGRVNALMSVIRQVNPDLVMSVNIGDCLEAVRCLKRSGMNHLRLAMSIHAIEGDYIADLKHYSDVIDSVIYTNRLLKSIICESLQFDQSRMFYAPYGVVPQSSTPHYDRFHNRILWMGRMDQDQKRCLELPGIARELAAITSDWNLLLAGEGPERNELINQLKATKECNFDYLGSLSQAALLDEILPTVDILLVNSLWETGPITILEAMSAGVAVVTSRYVGCGQEGALVDNENVLMFETGELSAAADCLSRLLCDPALRQKLISGGDKLVSTRYTRKVSVMAWVEALTATQALPVLPSPAVLNSEGNHGRLDRWFGAVTGERLRNLLGLSWQHQSAGSEWPHARVGISQGERAMFLADAAQIDQVN